MRAALIRSARRTRDVPPLDHTVESLLSSVSTLALGYELSGEQSLLDELRTRIEVLRMDPLPRPIDGSWTQGELFAALDARDRLPGGARTPACGVALHQRPAGVRVDARLHPALRVGSAASSRFGDCADRREVRPAAPLPGSATRSARSAGRTRRCPPNPRPRSAPRTCPPRRTGSRNGARRMRSNPWPG